MNKFLKENWVNVFTLALLAISLLIWGTRSYNSYQKGYRMGKFDAYSYVANCHQDLYAVYAAEMMNEIERIDGFTPKVVRCTLEEQVFEQVGR